MTCSEYRDRIEELLDGLLPPEEAGRFDAHVADCGECAERFEDAAQFRALLDDEGGEAVGEWVVHQLAMRAAADAAAHESGPLGDAPVRPAAAIRQVGAARPVGGNPAAAEAPVPSDSAVETGTGTGTGSERSSEIGTDTRPLTGMVIPDTQEIPRGELLPRTRLFVPRPRTRWEAARLAAAAVLVAAVGFFSAGLMGDSDVLALSAGVETRIESGHVASAGEGRRISAEDRAVVITMVPDSDGAALEMERGVALFHVDAGRPLAVTTAAGVAKGVGASFIVDVRGDGAVAVGGVTGRVQFERDGERTTLRTGERIEIDRRGAVRLVSGARIDRLEVENALRESEMQRLRDHLDIAEEQLVAYGAAAGQGGDGTSADDGALPIDELGRAMRTLIDTSLGRKDTTRLKAMAVFLANADRIQNEYGSSDPWSAMRDPRFMAAISESFVRALAPEASEVAIASATTDWHRATDDVLITMDSDPMPSEVAVARSRAFAQVIRGIERHLGADAAAEVVRGGHAWSELRPHAQNLDDRVESRYVSYWQKRFDMDDVQSNQLAVIVRNYITETVHAQGVIAATLPPNEVEGALYPRWSRGGWGRRGKSKKPTTDDAPEPLASEVVSARLRKVEARIQLAEPRIRFERALWNVLRSDQREKGFGWGARVNSFREAPVE